MKYSDFDLMRAVVRKVSYMVPQSKEARLMFAVFEQAAFDCINKGVHYSDQNSGYHYIVNSSMPHLRYINIDPEWVRRLFKDAGIAFVLREPPKKPGPKRKLVGGGGVALAARAEKLYSS